MGKEKFASILSNVVLVFLFLYSTSPFIGSRASQFYSAAKTLWSNTLPAAYQNNNRYYPISRALSQHPDSRFIYVFKKGDPSWFKIQIVYEGYPRTPELRMLSDKNMVEGVTLATLPKGTVVTSLHKLRDLSNNASELYLSDEYYLYIVK